MNSRQQEKPGKLSVLLTTHKKTARACLLELLATPLATAVTMGVIGFALLLPALLYVVTLNLDSSLAELNAPARASVFLESGLTDAQASEVSDRLQTMSGLESVALVTPTQALEEFSSSASLGDVLFSLPDNPLPHTLLLTLDVSSLENAELLISNLEAEPEVEAVQLDLLWLQRLQGIAGLVNRLGLLLLVVVVVGLLAIVGNTIKLAVAQRQQEIRVIKLIGGSNAFIARPFLYRGTFLGLGGAILACLLLSGLLWMLAGPVGTLSQLYGGGFDLAFLSPGGNGLLLLLGAGTGWIAAFLSSWRNIAAIEP